MYLQFYGFKEAPFNLTPDSKFLFLSHRHQEALAALLFGVQERKGFICLTGEIGCGKTTLCRAMLSQLDPEQVRMCVVLNSYLTDLELLKTINEGFNLPAESDSKKKLIDTLNEYLVHEFSNGHNVVLIIDESQNLRPETLEQIRMISNLETETAKLIQIVLIGQPELRKTLVLPELEQLNQRITVRYHIAPLDETEVAEYIRHRLAVAEPQVDVTFSPQAVRLIYHYSRGIPRRINVICDRCLLVGYVTGSFHIDDKAVERAVNEVSGDLGRYTPAPVSAGGEPEEIVDVAAGRRRVKLVLQSLKVAAYFLAIIMGVVLATWWSQNKWIGMSNAGQPKEVVKADDSKSKDEDKKSSKSSKRKQSKPAEETASLAGAETSTSTVAVPTPSPTPTPTPAPTPVIYADWQADPDGVLRVANRRLAETAAYLNLLKLWNIEPDLEPFRAASPEDVAQFDMLKTVQQLNFYNIQSDTLAEAFKLGLPVLVHLRDPEGAETWSVIGALQGEVIELIDPLAGRRSVKRDKLEPMVTHATVLFLDNTGVAGLKPGDQGETVLALQNWLVQEGLFQGTPDGKFGPQTRVAIEKFQQQTGLKETGTIDSLTGAIVASRLNPRRPRLY